MSVLDPSQAAMSPVFRRGVVAVVTQAERFLVIRRSQTIAAPGMFCFPGGGIEPGETEPLAIRREFLEELGATFIPQRRVWRCQTAWRVDLAWWVGAMADVEAIAPNPAEVASVHWLSSQELAELPNLLDSNHEFLRQLAAGRITL